MKRVMRDAQVAYAASSLDKHGEVCIMSTYHDSWGGDPGRRNDMSKDSPSLEERMGALEEKIDKIVEAMDPTPSVQRAIDNEEETAKLEADEKEVEEAWEGLFKSMDKVFNTYETVFYRPAVRFRWWRG